MTPWMQPYFVIPAYLLIGVAIAQSLLWICPVETLLEAMDEVVAEAKSRGDWDPRTEALIRAYYRPTIYGIGAVAWPLLIGEALWRQLKKLVR